MSKIKTEKKLNMNTNRPCISRMLNAKFLVHVALLIFLVSHPLKTDICSAQGEIWAVKEVTASLPDLAGN